MRAHPGSWIQVSHGLTPSNFECRPSGVHQTSQNPRNAIFAEKKAPAAAGKTSTKLIHVTKYQERNFCLKICLKKTPAAAWKTSTKLILVVTNPGKPFPAKKKRLRQPRRPHQTNGVQMMSLNVVRCR